MHVCIHVSMSTHPYFFVRNFCFFLLLYEKYTRCVHTHTPTGPRDQRGAPLSVYIHSYVHVCFIHTCIFPPFRNVKSVTFIHVYTQLCINIFLYFFTGVYKHTRSWGPAEKRMHLFMKHTYVYETYVCLRNTHGLEDQQVCVYFLNVCLTNICIFVFPFWNVNNIYVYTHTCWTSRSRSAASSSSDFAGSG